MFFIFSFFSLSLQPRNWNRPWSLVILSTQHLSLSAPSRRPQGTLLVKTAPSKPPPLLTETFPRWADARGIPRVPRERGKHGCPLVWGSISISLEETSLGFTRKVAESLGMHPGIWEILVLFVDGWKKSSLVFPQLAVGNLGYLFQVSLPKAPNLQIHWSVMDWKWFLAV